MSDQLKNAHEQNPWLRVSSDDYETHMRRAGQLQLLNQIFCKAIQNEKPTSLAILGVTTGNGLEHIDPNTTSRIIGIDINREYLELTKERFPNLSDRMELICSDLLTVQMPARCNWIYAALIFEYVDPDLLIPLLREWTCENGVVTVVLQQQSSTTPNVSSTGVTSLSALSKILRVRDADTIRSSFENNGFFCRDVQCIPLNEYKSFCIMNYARRQT